MFVRVQVVSVSADGAVYVLRRSKSNGEEYWVLIPILEGSKGKLRVLEILLRTLGAVLERSTSRSGLLSGLVSSISP